ncbi:DUF4422 domain-containing protein [Pararhodonellum marinum]|uniref:DUF4422 domain-containing protein n=1 Tax=Pararhodonellum marinum TaxID=2755358 RepID=UPI001890655B|nr:DUF4422 domain-containing protein [Pararhodonellum marinum]
MSSNSKIYIIHYKRGKILKDDALYQPLMSGNVFVDETKPFVGDDSGKNISDKNRYFSELTGIYWVWKNTHQAVTGFCHYRRFYTAQAEPFFYRMKRSIYPLIGLSFKRFGLIYTQNTKLFSPRILSEHELSEIFKDHDAILPQARKLRYSVEEHYRRYHDIEDLKLIKKILKERHPSYLNAYEAVLKGDRLYANNMFILKDAEYQKFMSWWFDMIFEFERRVDIKQYDGYQKRIIGFIAERLLTIWFKKEQLKCKELQLIYFKDFKYE